MSATDEAGAAAERAVRTSYGRLVALLAGGTGDLALAEDCLADALERALDPRRRNRVLRAVRGATVTPEPQVSGASPDIAGKEL